jgi:5-methylcytosine-specific restriction endonuclease McrA
LLKDGLKNNLCELCKIEEWLDKPIKLELHHIDGNKNNNSLDNIQLLCPNCHSFTDNYRGKNIKKMVDIIPDIM